MNLNIDKQNGFMSTSGAETITALSYTIQQNSYNTMFIKANMVDQVTGKMGTCQFIACVQRAQSSCRLVQLVETVDFIGDAALSTATVALNVDGASISVQVVGIAGINLDWCIQLQIDCLTNQ